MDRLPRRPHAALWQRPPGRARQGARRERDDRADARRVAERRAEAAEERHELVRSRVPLRRPGRVRPQHAAAGDGSADDDLGHAEVGERDKGPAYLPTKMADFQNFARALATRYNGKRAGYPFVRFYGIWNESNLGNFLAPQFDKKGKIVSPAAYAKLAAAGYAGIKAGSPKALVAIGETSSNGKDKPKQGSTDSTTPGTFAKLVAQANKKLKFDAWAQHPYPGAGQPGAGAEGALPERRLQHDEAVREGSRQVVRPQEHPGLGHRVRQRDEAGRAEGRHRGAAGRVRAAGDRVREEGPADPDVHLVRLPRLGGQPLAERRLSQPRARPSRPPRSGHPPRRVSTS